MKRVSMSILTVLASAIVWIALSSGYLTGWDAVAAHDRASRDGFVSIHAGKTVAPPFAFVYGGKASSGLVGKWKVTSDEKAQGAKTTRTVVYSDPSTGLRVTVVYTIYRDYPAVEWVVQLKNESKSATPIIENVQACAVSFPEFASGPGPVMLYRALGSNALRSDFGPVTDTLAEKAAVRFGPTAGRSSDTNALPFFNIASAGRGVVAAIGWSGSWQAVVGRKSPRALDLTAGMTATHFKLLPGEEVRTPSMALLFWKSPDRMDGHNLFRRFVLAHHTPQANGKPVPLPINHGVGFGGPFPCNEYVCATESYAIGMIGRLHQFGIAPDACWIDAGWYENATRSWWSGVGSWVVNKTNFPRGLKPVTEAAKKLGQGFVVWFEPERVYEGTRLDSEHADWLTKLPGNPNRLLDLGNPVALAWITDHIANFIRDEGVTVYRQDFNFDPAPFWKAMDMPDRVGIAEMKHIAGLYAYWDALLARNPGLLIDNCASGGRRIDLETIGRSIALWRTDYQYYEPSGYQCHTYGLHFFLPASGTGNANPQKYYFRSSMGGAVVMGWELNGAFNVDLAIDDIAEFRSLRAYLYGDYYPLTEYSTGDDAWAAFEWNRPEERDGIVLAFRRPMAREASITVKLGGLEVGADYEVSYEDYGVALVKSGRELGEGLAVKIPEAPGSLLIKYRRVR